MNATKPSTITEADYAAPLTVAEAECAVLWDECEHAGDIYYRRMREWIDSKQSLQAQAECYVAALYYRARLDIFIAHSEPCDAHNLRTAVEYRTLLQPTIEQLSPRRLWSRGQERIDQQLSNAEM